MNISGLCTRLDFSVCVRAISLHTDTKRDFYVGDQLCGWPYVCWIIQTLLFMKAFKHWISLCWLRLSMGSCLEKRKRKDRFYVLRWMKSTLCKNSTTNIWGDSLFLVQQLLQCLQKKSETLMAKVINPTVNKTHRQKKLVTRYSF